MALTPKQLVLDRIAHRETQVTPYTLSFEGDVAQRLDAYYGDEAWRGKLNNAIQRAPGPNLVVDTEAEHTSTDLYGSVWQVDRRPFHLLEPVLKAPSLEGYAMPDLGVAFAPDWQEEAERTIAAMPDHYWVAGFGFGLYERTWTLRGFDEALMDAAGDPGFYDELVEVVAEHQMAIIGRLLELPIDGVMFSDDWGYQQGVLLGPERWRRFLKPRLARMYDQVHAAGR